MIVRPQKPWWKLPLVSFVAGLTIVFFAFILACDYANAADVYLYNHLTWDSWGSSTTDHRLIGTDAQTILTPYIGQTFSSADLLVKNNFDGPCGGYVYVQITYTGCDSTCLYDSYSDSFEFAASGDTHVFHFSGFSSEPIAEPTTSDDFHVHFYPFLESGECDVPADWQVGIEADSVAGWYIYGNETQDLSARLAVTEPSADPRENPVATVLIPTDGADVQQQDINAVGAAAYYFTVASDVLSTEYPNESSAVLDVEVYNDDGTTLFCAMEGTANSSDIDGSYHYGGQVNQFVNGTPDVCPNFPLSGEGESYKIQARWTFNATGAWSEVGTFAVRPYGWTPPIDCTGAELFSPCWFQNTLSFLFSPSEGSVSALFATLDSFTGKWPFSWFTDSFDVFVGAVNQTPADLGEVHAGNYLTGDYPNGAWYVSNLTSLYGDWAGGATAAFIWIGALISIGRAGKRFLNIDDDDGLELG